MHENAKFVCFIYMQPEKVKFKSVQVNMKHVLYATEQSWCYIKFFKRKTKYAYSLFLLPSNQFTRYFHKHTTLRYFGNYFGEGYPTNCMVMYN